MSTATKPRERPAFFCRSCGTEHPKWHGRCPDCGEWGSLSEEALPGPLPTGRPITLEEVDTRDSARLETGLAEFDRVLGGGLVAGSTVLLAGEPGIGKSTLLLHASAGIAARGSTVLYASGEESPGQIRLRAERLDSVHPGILLCPGSDLKGVLAQARAVAPRLLVVDSIQTTSLSEVGSAAGTVAQVRECAAALAAFAMETGISVVLLGHVTKSGEIAGPMALSHVVDAVLSLEGDRYHACRVLRGLKNRFGTTDEVGLFEMGPAGLAEIASPTGLLPEGAPGPGSVVVPAVEGTRALLVEVQALSAKSTTPPVRRRATGIDPIRLELLLAVLVKKERLPLGGEDVYVKVAGGVRIEEPGTDLAVALAVVSSFSERELPPETVAFGEIGLRGDVRPVARSRARLSEAVKMGYRRALVPPGTDSPGGIAATEVRTLSDALAELAG